MECIYLEYLRKKKCPLAFIPINKAVSVGVGIFDAIELLLISGVKIE